MKNYELGDKVKYVRVKAEPGTPDELVYGSGHVVGKIIGVSGHLQYSVKDGDRTFNIQSNCIDPDEGCGSALMDHHQKLQQVVKDHNEHVKSEVDRVNKIVEEMNIVFFGPKVVLNETGSDN